MSDSCADNCYYNGYCDVNILTAKHMSLVVLGQFFSEFMWEVNNVTLPNLNIIQTRNYII